MLDPRKIQQLTSLMYGMQWFLDQITHLRNPSDVLNTIGNSANIKLLNIAKTKSILQVLENLTLEDSKSGVYF